MYGRHFSSSILLLFCQQKKPFINIISCVSFAIEKINKNNTSFQHLSQVLSGCIFSDEHWRDICMCVTSLHCNIAKQW